MAKKKKKPENKKINNPDVTGLHSEVVDQPITETLESNYMPYAMSVIISRAIPEIDGFKPSHRKLLYTMYKMGLLTGPRQKSANIVGRTMQLNPHGDAAIYDTMVRLSAGQEALLVPFVDSKGNFGKVYSRDIAYAASRYTEAKLTPICAEIFRDIDKDTVDFVDSYDGTQQEPTLLPTAFPNILVSENMGIAVGMASNICGFNLNEVCETTINYIKDPDFDILNTLPAPDFTTGGEIIYDREEMRKIYETGRGSFKVRAKWRYVKEDNLIEIYQIPYTTSTDIIIDRIVALSKEKNSKITEITNVRDETDRSGLRIAIDLKRGSDPEKLMQKLFKLTTLQDPFPCNFNILIAGYPMVLGVRQILDEWVAWRTESVKRRLFYDRQKKSDKLHLLCGLEKILLDIDKAIKIIRGTELESEVVPNLMIGFGIDEIQANFVAEIKLRNINREYIIKRIDEKNDLEKEIAGIDDILSSTRKIKGVIIDDLKRINEKYITPRKTELVYAAEIEDIIIEDKVEDYPVTIFVSKEGYFKKITAQSLRMSSEQKFKEGDSLSAKFESGNAHELLVFSDRQQVYKCRVCDFEDTKASALGIYLPTKLEMDDGEKVISVIDAGDYKNNILFFYENGKVSRISLSAYATKTKRRKLINAYSDKSTLIKVLVLDDEKDIVCYSSDDRAVIFNSSLVAVKETKTTAGVACMTVKKQKTMINAEFFENSVITNKSRYRVKNIPGAGAVLKIEDKGGEQISILDFDNE